tara:strand:+ start:190 stop:378 length:189 start_codon:yes stop_codon:yes gene_type:complete
MTEKKKKSVIKYKAVNPKEFAAMHNDKVPNFKELSEGESIEIDKGIKYHVYWLNNNILIKEK